MQGHNILTPASFASSEIITSVLPQIPHLFQTHFSLDISAPIKMYSNRMLNSGYTVQEIVEYFKTYVPVKDRIAQKFKEYKELTEKLKNGEKGRLITLT